MGIFSTRALTFVSAAVVLPAYPVVGAHVHHGHAHHGVHISPVGAGSR